MIPAILVDVDGTVAIKGDRSIYDESRVHLDLPNVPVIQTIRAMEAYGYRVVFASGRSDACREATHAWLEEHVQVAFEALYMRNAKTEKGIPDVAVKRRIYNEHIADNYQVLCVFDDRNSVVRLWRDLGLTVMQVADGDF